MEGCDGARQLGCHSTIIVLCWKQTYNTHREIAVIPCSLRGTVCKHRCFSAGDHNTSPHQVCNLSYSEIYVCTTYTRIYTQWQPKLVCVCWLMKIKFLICIQLHLFFFYLSFLNTLTHLNVIIHMPFYGLWLIQPN